MEKSVGFTGTRNGLTDVQKQSLAALIGSIYICSDKLEAHHGDCVGADAQFHDIVESNGGWRIYIHPPIINKYRAHKKSPYILERKLYLERNKDIVKLSDIVIVCPKQNKKPVRGLGGTWWTYQHAKYLSFDRKDYYGIRDNRKDIFIIYPDGRTVLDY